ncbi:MAG: M50 family metallopeptidase [Patescibacteria group bacterium]|nr:M50 family metallopeptidase [Patescibacteria group bacterium]
MAIISFFIILSILIMVHELGHFFMARKFGIKVEEFGFGYPPRLFGVKKRGTIFSLNFLPFGGFVRLKGEDLTAGKNSFAGKPKRVRALVLLAGVAMNFLLGVVLFAAIYTRLGIPEKVDYLVVTNVVKDSPAEAAGIKVEDKIVNYDGTENFINYINDHRGQEVSLRLKDGREVSVIPRLAEDTPQGQGALGVAITNVDAVLYPLWQRPFRGMWFGLKEAVGWGKEILSGLGKMVFELFRGQLPQDVAGPVGIYKISKDVGQQGFLAILQFMAILSINLSILNLLPLPALDGGRLIFIAIEAVVKKRVKPEWEQAIHLTGMLILIGLMILVTVGDVKRLMGS